MNNKVTIELENNLKKLEINLKNGKRKKRIRNAKKRIKKISRLFYIFMGMLLLLTGSTVNAFSETTSVNFQAREVYKEVIYNGIQMEIPIANCTDFVNKVPIYALDNEKTYKLNPSVGFYTYINIIIQGNDQVRNALLLGYPNNTVEQLNLTDTKEAYIITQLAVLDAYYNYDLEKFDVTKENKYPNFIENLKSFVKKVRNSTNKKIVPDITIDAIQLNWTKIDESNQVKTYQILSNIQLKEYTVRILSEQHESIQILDEDNNLQTAFLNGEKFKILLPSNQDIEFEIRVEATFETNPIKLGKSPGEQWVSYVLLGKTEKKQANLLDYFKTNPQKEQENVEENKEEDKTQEVIQKEIINQIETPKKEIKKLPQTGF